MKLYLFSTTTRSIGLRMTMEEIEVEEKPKTYINLNKYAYYKRINKDDIGKIMSINNNDCFLLENNPSEAAKIFMKHKKWQLDGIKKELEKNNLKLRNLKST